MIIIYLNSRHEKDLKANVILLIVFQQIDIAQIEDDLNDDINEHKKENRTVIIISYSNLGCLFIVDQTISIKLD